MRLTVMAAERGELLAGSAYYDWMGVLVVGGQTGAAELLLPYRDEFGCTSGSAAIHTGMIASFADVAARVLLAKALGANAVLQALQIEHIAPAAAGNQLRASGSVIDQQIVIQIVTNDDQTLIARATGSFQTQQRARALPTMTPAAQPPLQPIYPN